MVTLSQSSHCYLYFSTSNGKKVCMKFKFPVPLLQAVKMSMLVLRVIMLCGLVCKCKHLPTERQYLPTSAQHTAVNWSLYLWILYFLQSEEASTGVCCEGLFRVRHQVKTWMHRQPFFTVIISRNKYNIDKWYITQDIMVFPNPCMQTVTTTSCLHVMKCYSIL